MDFFKLLDNCSLDTVKAENFCIGDGVLPEILKFSKDFDSITLVFDTNTYAVCAKQVKELLKSKSVVTHVFGRDGVC